MEGDREVYDQQLYLWRFPKVVGWLGFASFASADRVLSPRPRSSDEPWIRGPNPSNTSANERCQRMEQRRPISFTQPITPFYPASCIVHRVNSDRLPSGFGISLGARLKRMCVIGAKRRKSETIRGLPRWFMAEATSFA